MPFLISQIKHFKTNLKRESFSIIFLFFVACPFGIGDKLKSDRMLVVIIVGNCVS